MRAHFHYKKPIEIGKRYEWWNPLSWFGGDDNEAVNESHVTQTTAPQFTATPEYPEATGARQNWWQTLQDWQKQPGYGVVQQDYNDIYSKAAEKINQYYWGGPSGQPGLQDKMAASAARRGVSENPVADVMKQRTGAQEAYDLGQANMTVNQAKATANETGRLNWMTSLQNLAGMQMPGTWSGGTIQRDAYEPTGQSAGGTFLSGAGQEVGSQSENNWLDQMLAAFNTDMPNTSQNSLTASVAPGNYSAGGGNYNDWQNTLGW